MYFCTQAEYSVQITKKAKARDDICDNSWQIDDVWDQGAQTVTYAGPVKFYQSIYYECTLIIALSYVSFLIIYVYKKREIIVRLINNKAIGFFSQGQNPIKKCSVLFVRSHDSEQFFVFKKCLFYNNNQIANLSMPLIKALV